MSRSPTSGSAADQLPEPAGPLRPPVQLRLACWIWIATVLVRSVLLLVDARTVMQLGVVPVPWFTAFVIVPILVMSSVVAFWVALAVAVCVVDVLLVLPALGLRAGHAWARFVLTLLIVLNLLSSVGSRAPLGLVSLVPDLAVLVLMYLPPAHRHLTRCAAERDRQRRLLRTEFLKG